MKGAAAPIASGLRIRPIGSARHQHEHFRAGGDPQQNFHHEQLAVRDRISEQLPQIERRAEAGGYHRRELPVQHHEQQAAGERVEEVFALSVWREKNSIAPQREEAPEAVEDRPGHSRKERTCAPRAPTRNRMLSNCALRMAAIISSP